MTASTIQAPTATPTTLRSSAAETRTTSPIRAICTGAVGPVRRSARDDEPPRCGPRGTLVLCGRCGRLPTVTAAQQTADRETGRDRHEAPRTETDRNVPRSPLRHVHPPGDPRPRGM